MSESWTGGQYSLYRAVLGTYLFVHFVLESAFLAAWNGPVVLATILTVAAVSSVLFAIGWHDRPAALLLLLSWVSLSFRTSPILDPGALFVAFLLLAHLFIPTAPFGSWAARGRVDPAGDWRLPSWITAVAWLVIFLGFASWLLQLLRMPLVDAPGFSPGTVMLLLFAFDPAWIRALRPGSVDRLFYDGTCGMCHGTVRFLLSEDTSGTAFRFAPLDSDSFRSAVPSDRRADLPDSVVLLTADGDLLVRSRAILVSMKRLGGYWRAIAVVLGVVPRTFADWVYDRIAAVRYKLFRRPDEACPVLPPRLRARFDV
ncbi:MAG: DUF393 domain-containing protein [Acidobacteriota bacterium]|nr:DUF393 domain-containing protein [Acidobacteriota bacterium]